MKYFKISAIQCALALLFAATVHAQVTQKVKLKATVYGAARQPLKGAVIQSLEEDNNQTISDSAGVFSLEVPLNAPLSATAKGYNILYFTAATNVTELTLIGEDVKDVQVAFRKVPQPDLLGGVSAVSVTGLLKDNYTTYSLEGMDALAPGYNGNSLWGMGNYLTLVDGFPRDASSVLPTEIEDISFLKSANAVALYGSRAAKGVVYITTKKGKAGKTNIEIRANGGVNVPKDYPLYVGSAEYMTLYNEARRNDRLPDLYSEETIYNYASGKNPYRYPNVDYYSSEYLKQMFPRYDATAEISGGNDKARYYTNIGYQTTGSLLNFGEAVKNDRSERLNIRGNIDVSINKYITANVNASTIFYTGHGVNADYWGSAATLRPYRYAPLIPVSMIEEGDEASQLLVQNSNNIIDGQYLLGGTQLNQTNPIASVYAGGHNKYVNRQFQFNSGINADLRNLLKGLSFSTSFAIDYATSYNLSYNYSYATYEAAWNSYSGEDLISSLTKYGQDATSGVQNVSNSWYKQSLAFTGQFNYVNTFGNKHNVSAVVLLNEFQQSESAIYHKTSNANLGFQAAYNYGHKYYFDFSGAMIHSAKLPEANRNAFSPTVSLGWRLTGENFLKNSQVVDELKLTASAGILNTDLDINDYYMYLGYYTGLGSWYGWKDGTGIQSTESRRGDNPAMNFPKRKEISVGVEGSFFKKFLVLNGSFFVNKISGNIIQASVLFPNYFTTGWPVSSFIPFVNYNDDKRVGFDFSAALNHRIGKVDLNLGVTGTYYKTTASKRAELYENDYQFRQGKPLDALWGLQNLGFFKDQDDINNSPSQAFGQVRPGDIKYKDQNGDGIVDTQDEVYLGRGGWFGAPFTMGLNLSAKWKNLTFYALGTGRFGGYAMKNNSYFWVDGEDKYSVVVRDRWTEETQNTAKYPRLTTKSSDNNLRSSDFWIYKTNRFDLSKVQVSYDMSGMLKNKNFIKELGIYVSGFNLLTLAPERDILQLNIGAAPQTRMYNLGVKTLF